MMQEGDKQSLWHLLEAGEKYLLSAFSFPSSHTYNCLSVALFLGHVPWLEPYFAAIPFVGADKKAFAKFCLSRGAIRREQGSTSKDVFYHLVGVLSLPPIVGILIG